MRILYSFLILLFICNPSYAKRLDEMNANTSPDITNDLIYSQDVSDTSESLHGTGKSLTIKNLLKAGKITVDGTNVGINSVNPTQQVDVIGAVKATSFIGDGSSLTGVTASGSVSDDAYGISWNGETSIAPSKNAVYDKIQTISSSTGIYFNVVSYGAVGDGTTNDTSFVQAAIDAAHNAGGGTVFFPRGTYSISDLTYYDDVSLLGENREASILKARSGTTNMLYWTNLLTDTFTPLYTYIRDLQFDGNSVSGVTGIRLLNSPFFTLENVRIHHCDIGLYATGNYLANITGSRFTFNRVGIYFDRATLPSSENLPQEITISHSSITANTEWGLKSNVISSLILTSIDVEQNGTSGDLNTGGILMQTLTSDASSGGVGLVIKNAWFEANRGQADIQIESTVNSNTISLVVDSSSFDEYVNTGTRAQYYIYSPNAIADVLISNSSFVGTIDNYVVGGYKTINVAATNTDNAYRRDVFSAIGTQNGYMSQIASTKHMSLIDTQSSSSTSGPGLNLMSADKAALASGDRLGALNFIGSTSSTTSEFSSRIQSFADGAWGSGDAPSKITFDTVPDGTTTRTERMVIKNDGNVGIATVSPISTLQVVGTVNATAFIGDGSGLTGISGGGSIGIGTANTITFWPTTTTIGSLPTATYPSLTELSYVKGATSNIQTQINGLSSGAGGWTDGGTNVYNTETSDNVGIGTTTPTASLLVENVGTQDSFRVNDASADSTPFIISSAGNVGIGTLATDRGLLTIKQTTDTNGNGLILLNTAASGSNRLWVDTGNASRWDSGASSTNQILLNGGGGTSSGNIGIGTSTTSALLDVSSKATKNLFLVGDDGSGDTTPFVVSSEGNVGIGSLSPGTKLDVQGTVRATAFSGDGSALTGVSAGGWVDGGTNIYASPTTDNVAIGTTTPTQKLTVVGTVSATAFVGDGSGLTNLGSSAWTDGGTNVYVSPTTDNVGIGTTTPSTNFKADIRGNLYVSGNVGIGTLLPRGTLDLGPTGTVYAQTFTGPTGPTILGTSNNVGIGTITAGSLLTVGSTGQVTVSSAGAIATSSTVSVADDAYAAGWNASTAVPTKNAVYDKIETLGSGGWTDGSAAVYPTTSTDNVGIGTVSPGKKLDLYGTDSDIRMNSTDTAQFTGFQFYNGTTQVGEFGAGGSTTSTPNQIFLEHVVPNAPIDFMNDTGIQLRIKGPNVGIGTTGSGGAIFVSPDGSCSKCGPNNADVWACASVTCL